MNRKYILIDLDGTLTDSMPGIVNSTAYALEKIGVIENDRNKLRRFVGPPLRVSFSEFYGLDEQQCEQALAYYREYYVGQNGMFENNVYEGIPELLNELKQAGKTLLLATSKPIIYARQIIERYGLAVYFDYAGGAELDGRRDAKAEVISYVLEQAGITDVSRVIMVGDREHDVLGAKECGIECIGVLYGYGSRQEMEEAGADYIVDNVAELRRILLG